MEYHVFQLDHTPSLMYKLCKVQNAGQVERSAACLNWFRNATDHCTSVLDTSQHSVLGRAVAFLLPSFRKLRNFEEITNVNTDLLSESDCKLLLSKMARDYVAREPHYELSEYTVLALWATLILTVAIIALVAMGAVYTRFRGKIQKIFDDKKNGVHIDQSGAAEDEADERPKDPNKESSKIEEVLKYDIMATEEKYLNVVKNGPKTSRDAENSLVKSYATDEAMGNSLQMVRYQDVSGYVEPLRPFDDEFID